MIGDTEHAMHVTSLLGLRRSKEENLSSQSRIRSEVNRLYARQDPLPSIFF